MGEGGRGEENGRVGWGKFSRDGVIGPTPSKARELHGGQYIIGLICTDR